MTNDTVYVVVLHDKGKGKGTKKISVGTLDSYELFQNYPNPFNPTTTIRFQIPEQSFVTLQIYNVTGSLVKTLVSENLSTGFYNFVWDGKNNGGQLVSSGIYIFRIQAGEFTDIKRMTFIK